MEQEEIKRVCEFCYGSIKIAEDELKKMRSICKHANTHEGNYSWRIGNIQPAIICSDCGSLVKYK